MKTTRQAETRQEITLSAVVTRADGTVEDLGVIAQTYRSPLARLRARLTGRGVITTRKEPKT